ncbi:hypothetical protein DPEC_G00226890 [Dallia pectoralis]|uniref:Uncharacterized protein n=1 Tax=Dallia pectoralis TaxID=75939 RepID=A0ACC2G0X7_DALPE|nr:hypothetical protein DPEC_G00226890 [Dallia pectoralis]
MSRLSCRLFIWLPVTRPLQWLLWCFPFDSSFLNWSALCCIVVCCASLLSPSVTRGRYYEPLEEHDRNVLSFQRSHGQDRRAPALSEETHSWWEAQPVSPLFPDREL